MPFSTGRQQRNPGNISWMRAIPVVAAPPLLGVIASGCGVLDGPDFTGEVIDSAGAEQVLVRFDEEHEDLGDDPYVWLGDIDGSGRSRGTMWLSGYLAALATPTRLAFRLRGFG